MRDLRRKLLSLGNHFFERLKTANFSTACGTSTLKSLPSRAFFVSDVHLRPRKHFSRCTLDCGFKTAESPALRGFEAGPRALATAALYLVLKSNGLRLSKNLPAKFGFSPKPIPTNIAKKLPPQRCSKPFLIPIFNFSHKRHTFAFAGESGYTLGFTQKIAHKGTHGETGGFTFVQSCRAFDRPSSGKRTAGGSGCTPTACVRFLRHRSPAGLRNILFGLPMLYFSRSAHGDFCVCEVKAVPRPCGQYAGHLSAWRPGTCPAGPPAGCTAA